MSEQVILVDEKDNETGVMEKLEAHRRGLLHRAISLLIFNNNNEMMLQQRSYSKYHSPGLWTNTCCTHPRPGEEVEIAAHRRLREEMGFDCNLRELFGFTYKAEFDNGLTEHEYDHVLVGFYGQDPVINTEEANDFRWVDLKTLLQMMKEMPENYTVWFRIIIRELEERYPQLHAASFV